MGLSVFNLNIMHGRNKRSALWPLRVPRRDVEQNLLDIAACIRRHDPDFVTLQEVDEYSILSGGFNQFEFLKEKTGYPYGFFAPSCRVRGVFQSGQAILSKYPLKNRRAYKFPITFPTDRMGFVVANAVVPTASVSVASVHLVYLDLLHPSSRKMEWRMVEDVMSRRDKAIIGGDFNQDTSGFNVPTYPSWAPSENRDWILTKNLAVESCQTLPDRLSDHLAVFAKLI